MSTTPSPESDANGEQTESAADAQRRKFREALDRKKAGHHASVPGAVNGSHEAHTGPAKQQRQFRRKSG